MKPIRHVFAFLLTVIALALSQLATLPVNAAVSQAWTPNLFYTPAHDNQTDNGYSMYYDAVAGGSGDFCRPDPQQPPICFYHLNTEFYYYYSSFVIDDYWITSNTTGSDVTCSHNPTVKFLRCATDDSIQLGTGFYVMVEGHWSQEGDQLYYTRSRLSCGGSPCLTSGWDMSDDLEHSVIDD